jgi:hypothetical protein
MKITIEFDGIEEQQEARDALDGYKWKLAVWDIDQFLRSTTKYSKSIISHNEGASSEEIKVADKLREEIRDILSNYGLKLD